MIAHPGEVLKESTSNVDFFVYFAFFCGATEMQPSKQWNFPGKLISRRSHVLERAELFIEKKQLWGWS